MTTKSGQSIQWSDVVTPNLAEHGQGFKAYRHNNSSFDGLLNPVLNIDHYFMKQPTFPPHPHAGFSAITYMFEDSENGFINRDSHGSEIEIRPGDLHWTQAGNGILHEETPKVNGVVCHGLQIFINLPKKLKQNDPKIYHVDNLQAPRVKTADGIAEVKVASGQFENKLSPAQTDWPTDLLQMKWLKDGIVKIGLEAGQSALILNMAESIVISAPHSKLPKFSGIAAINRGNESQSFEIFAKENSDIVIIRSQVIDEPTVSQGPFVATDRKEMDLIINKYHRGEFGTLLPRN